MREIETTRIIKSVTCDRCGEKYPWPVDGFRTLVLDHTEWDEHRNALTSDEVDLCRSCQCWLYDKIAADRGLAEVQDEHAE